MSKITVVGAGNVGASAALYLAEAELGDVTLVDIAEGVAKGKGLDLLQAGPVRGYDSFVEGSGDIKAIAGSDVVIVTAGFPRKPGMSRLDLLKANADVIRGVAQAIRDHAPKAFVILVTNPLDVMTYLTFRITGFPRERVMGMAGVLDTARFRAFLAMEIGVSIEDMQAMVLWAGTATRWCPSPATPRSGECPSRTSSRRMMDTVSPTVHWFPSTWALNFVTFLTVFLYVGC